MSVLHAIGQALEKNIQTDVIYLDFAKAFDSVDHNILLAKLRVYEVSGQLLAWFTDCLTGRAQRVVLDDAASQWAPGYFRRPAREPVGAIIVHDLY